MNELHNQKKRNAIKWVIVLTAIALMSVIVAFAVVQSVPTKVVGGELAADEGGGEIIGESVVNGKSFTASVMSATTDTDTWTSLGITMTESEKALIIDNYGFTGKQTVSSSVVVKNNINDTTISGNQIFSMTASLDKLGIPAPIMWLPKTNVFSDLPNYSVEKIVVNIDGKERPFAVFSLDNWGAVTYNPSSSIEITYMLLEPASLPEVPEKEGYTFVGWYYDEAFTQPYNNEPITADTNLYAKYEINTYTVSFVDEKGSCTEKKRTVNWNTVLTSLPTCNSVGYIFDGWYFEDGTQYTNQVIKSDTVLHARYTLRNVTVKFYVGNEVLSVKEVPYGTIFADLLKEANIPAKAVKAVKFEENEDFGVNSAEEKLVVSDITVEVGELTEADKAVATLRENKLAIIGGLCGVLLLVVLISVFGSLKRRKGRR